MDLKFNGQKYHGEIAMIDKETETQYHVNLGGNLEFTAHINDTGIWESENGSVDPELVAAAGNYIESLEDFEDVLLQLNGLRN
ncbi:MAG: hypothetical protein V4539_16510 [Bacteroidota bacterium]